MVACLLLVPVGAKPRQVTHFGVHLRPKAEVLWSHIEHMYGHSIVEERLPVGDEYGDASVSTDGFPTIKMAPDGATEDMVVHELLHLKLLANGFPICGWFIDKQYRPTPELDSATAWLTHNLRDAIQHWEFYPEIKRLGIVPDQPTAEEFRAFSKSGTFPGPFNHHRGLPPLAATARCLGKPIPKTRCS